MAKEISAPQAVNLLTEGTSIIGNVETKNDIRIDGIVKGKVTTTGRLVVGSSGKVEGDIECITIDVIGTVIGNISAKELVSLKSPAVVTGDIITPALSVEPGVIFNGSCKMGKLNYTNSSTATSK